MRVFFYFLSIYFSLLYSLCARVHIKYKIAPGRTEVLVNNLYMLQETICPNITSIIWAQQREEGYGLNTVYFHGKG